MTITITPTHMIRTPTDIHTITVGGGIIPTAMRSMVEGLVLEAADIMDTASMMAAVSMAEVVDSTEAVAADFMGAAVVTAAAVADK